MLQSQLCKNRRKPATPGRIRNESLGRVEPQKKLVGMGPGRDDGVVVARVERGCNPECFVCWNVKDFSLLNGIPEHRGVEFLFAAVNDREDDDVRERRNRGGHD